MARRRLDWSKRALADVDRISSWYAETASPEVARLAVKAILNASRRLASGIAGYRPGKYGTREYVMRRFPYILVYREAGAAIRIVRVMHQARQYFSC
ncbi:MAG: type II toxin-antitoxin system RelE/ParE family toxin [Burkholderiales bacterium]|jgi:plasmid stabilization system protein ParE